MTDMEEKLLDLHGIAERHGVKVRYGYIDGVNAFVYEIDGHYCIFLNRNLRGFAEIKELAHETAHTFAGVSHEEMQEWLKKNRKTTPKIWRLHI